MIYSLIFHTGVQADVDDAYNWYEDKDEGLGERFLEELAACYHKLETHPDFFGEASKKYRRLILNRFPYLIVFEIIKYKVMVLLFFIPAGIPKK